MQTGVRNFGGTRGAPRRTGRDNLRISARGSTENNMRAIFGDDLLVSTPGRNLTISAIKDDTDGPEEPVHTAKKSKMSLDDLTINRRRALLLNHEAITK